MKLLESTQNKIIKDKNCENVPHPKITEVVCNIVTLPTMIINKIQECCTHLFQINYLVDYLKFHQPILYFQKDLIQNFHKFKYGLQIKIVNH